MGRDTPNVTGLWRLREQHAARLRLRKHSRSYVHTYMFTPSGSASPGTRCFVRNARRLESSHLAVEPDRRIDQRHG